VFDRTAALAQSLLLGMLAVAVVAAERSVTRGQRHARMERRGSRPLRVPLGRWKGPAAALVAAVVGLALVAPVGVLAFWAVRGALAGSTRAGALVGDVGGLAGPAANTAVLATVAALAALLAVLPVAYLTTRHASRLAGGANAVIVGGFALPGLVVALALTFWTL
jgi:iron(III) transport system permease protein